MPIVRQAIRRGGIRAASYERSTRVLEIEFDNGSVLQYSGVGEEVAQRFLRSSAPASYYKDNIEEEFAQRRLK